MNPVDRWLDRHDANDLTHGVRLAAASRVERLADSLWSWWAIEDLRYLGPLDHAVIAVVARLDTLAARLDR